MIEIVTCKKNNVFDLFVLTKIKGYRTIFYSMLLLVFSLNFLNAQEKNFSYFKLGVTNDQGELLLVKYKGIWELPGKKYIDPRTIREFTGFMAEELGVQFVDLNLGGLFTFYYNDATNPILFHYYLAKYESGDLEVPPGCTDIAWFNLQEALEIIPFKSMTLILEKLFEERGRSWGGALHIVKSGEHQIDSVNLKEEFYPISR